MRRKYKFINNFIPNKLSDQTILKDNQQKYLNRGALLKCMHTFHSNYIERKHLNTQIQKHIQTFQYFKLYLLFLHYFK